jgi:hypothetical protein
MLSPEAPTPTALQVNFDIDVPLFLGALYGDRRLHDISLLRSIEQQSGTNKFDGQVS